MMLDSIGLDWRTRQRMLFILNKCFVTRKLENISMKCKWDGLYVIVVVVVMVIVATAEQ